MFNATLCAAFAQTALQTTCSPSLLQLHAEFRVLHAQATHVVENSIPLPAGDSGRCQVPDAESWSQLFAKLGPIQHKSGADAELESSWLYRPAGNATLLVESDLAGWNNVRMSWEEALCLAYKTHRWYRVPHISTDYYTDIRRHYDEQGNGRPLTVFDYYDEYSFRHAVPTLLESDPLPPGGMFSPTSMLPIENLTDKEHTHIVFREGSRFPGNRMFDEYAGDQDFLPHSEYVHLVEKAFRVRQDLICLAVRCLLDYGLYPRGFVAIHRRKGDFSRQFTVTGNKAVARFIRPVVRSKAVLVLTDEYDDEFIGLLKNVSGAARVVCWANVLWQGDRKIFAPQVDMLAAVAAEEFIGTPLSTFTSGIIRWRTQAGTRAVGAMQHYLRAYEPGYGWWGSPGALGTWF